MHLDPQAPKFAFVQAMARRCRELGLAAAHIGPLIGRHWTYATQLRSGKQKLWFDDAVAIARHLDLSLGDAYRDWRDRPQPRPRHDR